MPNINASGSGLTHLNEHGLDQRFACHKDELMPVGLAKFAWAFRKLQVRGSEPKNTSSEGLALPLTLFGEAKPRLMQLQSTVQRGCVVLSPGAAPASS